MDSSVSHVSPAPSDEVTAQLLVDLGTALLRAANRLRQPQPVTVVQRPEGPVTHETRMRLQRAVLQALVDAGGSMPRTKFAKVAREVGYGRGYAQFYSAAKAGSKHGSLATLSADRSTVTITNKGRARLEYATEFLAEVDGE